SGSAASMYCAELVLFGATPNNLTVASTGVTPKDTITKMVVVARIKHVDTATAGTDYNFQVSRNGGANFTGNMTLHDRFTDPGESGVHVIESDPIDVSGQTSPSSMVIKFIGAN